MDSGKMGGAWWKRKKNEGVDEIKDEVDEIKDEVDDNREAPRKPTDPGECACCGQEISWLRRLNPKEKDQLHMKCREDQYNVGELEGWKKRLGKGGPEEKIVDRVQKDLNVLHTISEQIYDKYMELLQARGRPERAGVEKALFLMYKEFLELSANMQFWLHEKLDSRDIDEKQLDIILITLRRLTTNAEIANALQVKYDMQVLGLQAKEAEAKADKRFKENEENYEIQREELFAHFEEAEADAKKIAKESVDEAARRAEAHLQRCAEEARLNEKLVKENHHCKRLVKAYVARTGVDLHEETKRATPPPRPRVAARPAHQDQFAPRGAISYGGGAMRYKKKVNPPIKRKKTLKKKGGWESNGDSTKRKSTRVTVRRKTIKKKSLKKKSRINNK
jgi:hypothetical protein